MRNYRSFLIFSFIMIFILTLPGAVMSGGDNSLTVAGFDSEEMEKGAPSGWELVEKKGAVNLVLERVDDRYALHMKSDNQSSFGIKKELDVKAGEYTFLSWEWKVASLPVGADVRKANTDDQAIQIYVAFKPTGWPAKLKTPTIGYIWGVECPKDTIVTSQQPLASKVRYIVLRNKSDKLNEWYHEKRNLEEDYKKLFPDIDGGQPRDIAGISFYINSQHTKSEAESYLYNVRFSRD
ncbi:MAG: DUF3047 domain-containing protein [Syntrophobacterales bacterium]|nr:DUF3047 domain-containing protein [Syntrophobacterales bacterium]